MVFKICKNCKHWSDDIPYNYIMHPIDPDTCKRMEMPFGVRMCGHPGITLFERNPDPKGVSLCDGSDYMAEMYTGEKYGCVNFEKRKLR